MTDTRTIAAMLPADVLLQAVEDRLHDDILTVPDVAIQVERSPKRVRQLIDGEGRMDALPAVRLRIGGHGTYLVARDALDGWVRDTWDSA